MDKSKFLLPVEADFVVSQDDVLLLAYLPVYGLGLMMVRSSGLV